MNIKNYIKNTPIRMGWLILVMALWSCSNGPVPINYGKDFCDHCRMKIVEDRFGAEVVTKQGKAFKFDALECMINYYQELSDDKKENVTQFLVVNAAAKETLIDASNAFYLRSENFPSPMGSNISAYAKKEEREIFFNEYKGDFLNWEEAKAFVLTKNHTHH